MPTPTTGTDGRCYEGAYQEVPREAEEDDERSRDQLFVGCTKLDQEGIRDGETVSDLCLTCGGPPPTSSLLCVCGGVGTRDAETDGLRRYAFKLEKMIDTVRPALKWIRDHALSPDPHCLAEHAG